MRCLSLTPARACAEARGPTPAGGSAALDRSTRTRGRRGVFEHRDPSLPLDTAPAGPAREARVLAAGVELAR